jgi:Ca-activated chloride channel family protein
MPKNEGVSRTIIIATDGYVSIEKEAFNLIRNNLNEANMFAFGIGTGVNRYLIEGMARAGMGEPFIITKQAEADAQAEKFRKYILSPVLTKIKTEYKGFDVYDVEPPTIPDVLAERPIIIFGKWKNKPEGEIILRGYTGNKKKYNSKVKLSEVSPLKSNSALKYLWARHRITMLGDYNQLAPDDEKIKQITDLGLKYNLLTEYTSFVAIDSEIRNENGGTTTVKQPLPLPEGVSNLAVSRSPMLYKKSMGGKRGAMSNGIGGTGVMQVLGAPAELEDVMMKPEIKEGKKQIQCRLIDVKISIHSTKKMIIKQIESNIEDIISCITGKSNKVILKKKIEVEFILTPKGIAKMVTILKNETKNRKIEQCFIDIITKIKFTKPDTEKDIKVKCIFEYSG